MGHPAVGHLVVGPADHGVVRAATSVARGTVVTMPLLDWSRLDQLAAVDLVQIAYTDRLFGASVESAAVAFLELVEWLRRPVVVTLHDLPLPGQDELWRSRRAAAYEQIARAATGVVVSSQHESRLVRGARELAVLPLPLDRLPDPLERPTPLREAAVLGWIYPGKGHAEVLAALPPWLGLAALGGVSPGHEDLLESLEKQADGRLRVTGRLSEADLQAELHLAGVPVAAHRAVSASASVGRWLEAGRRPVVVDGAWVRELDERCPGAVRIVAPQGLRDAIDEAAADTDSTWLGDVAIGPSSDEVAAALERFCLSLLP